MSKREKSQQRGKLLAGVRGVALGAWSLEAERVVS